MACSRLSSPFLRARETKFRCIGRSCTAIQRPASILTPVLVMVLLAAVFAPTTAFSQNNPPPAPSSLSPTAIQVLDLNGKPIPGGGNGTYQQYTVDFTANGSSVNIWFAFRDDPADISFTDVSVTDLTNPGSNVLLNGNFSSGSGQSPTSWSWSNVSGINATDYGVVASGSSDCYTNSSCWFDGSLQGYDTIEQISIPTNPGDTFQLSFYVAEDSHCAEPNGTPISPCTFSDASTNGDTADSNGNGVDVVAYLDGGTLAPTQTLTVALLDSGTGYVTDTTGAISCGEAAGIFPVSGYTTCTATYQTGSSVELTAFPNEPTETTPATTLGAPAVTGPPAMPAIPGWSGCTVATGKNANPNVCSLTMDSAQTVTAAFVLPGESGETTLTVGTSTTVVSDNGGGSVPTCTGANPNPSTCGSELDVTLTGTWTTPVSATVVPFASCDTILQNTTQNDTSYADAYCFDIINGGTVSGGPEVDAPIGFEVTCPPSPTCGTEANPFDADLDPEFYLSLGAPENPGLSTGANGPLTNTLLYNSGNLYPGVIKYEATYSQEHPCALGPDASSLPTFSNQISSFTFLDGQPGGKTGTKSGGGGSCWLDVYNMPGEVPTASITGLGSTNPPGPPVSGLEYPQDTSNSSLYASFMCQAVNEGSSSSTGPYLTVASCTLNDTWTGGSASYSATIPSPDAQTAAATGGYATVTDPINVDTTNTGPHTLTATVVDSATDTITSSPAITYYVGNVTVTIGTMPSGLSFTVDGVNYNATQTLTWPIGTQHTLVTTSPQGPAGIQYTFTNWSDGTIGLTDTVTATAGTTSYTADFSTSYQLTTAVIGGGTVSPVSGSYYAAGTVVPLVATANPGYAFTTWAGPVANPSNASTTVTMSGPESVTANFVQTFVLTTAASPSTGGSVSPVSGNSYNSGTVVNLTATPAAGYVFASWTGPVANPNSASTTVTMSAAESVTANFNPVLTTATSPSAGGSVTSPASGSAFAPGTAVTVTEAANAGYAFSSWSGVTCTSTTATTCTFTMGTTPVTVTANFTGVWTITPASFNFGTFSVGQNSPSQAFVIYNPGPSAVKINVTIPGNNEDSNPQPPGDPDDFQFSSNPCNNATLAAKASCTVKVYFISDSDNLTLPPPGNYANLTVTNSLGTLLVAANLSGLTEDPTVSLTLPGSNPFASEAKGSTTTAAVATLNNTGPTTLILANLAISGSSTFTVAGGTNACTRYGTVASGASCVVYVTFKPTSTSAVAGTLTITDNATTGSGKQTVSLTGN